MQERNDMQMMENMSQCQLMQSLDEVSFAVNDLLLYLDTHPDCQEGLRKMDRYLEKRQRLLKTYARRFGPLTLDRMDLSNDNYWKWMKQPFPWQQEGGIR